MYSIHITYINIEGEEKLSIYYPVSGIAVDGNMVRLYEKDGIDKLHNYNKITKIVIKNYQ
jgi:hypothetical protein